ncbi:MAG: hypothetical protein NTY65_13935 [Planctomycetota bacterium]|nr:hypothetical protein [Planctomycetota bacterium]
MAAGKMKIESLCAMAAVLVLPVLAGCDGKVELQGQVVEGSGPASIFVPTEDMPASTGKFIEGATIELWEKGKQRLLAEKRSRADGYFDIGNIGLYESGMEYTLRAYADGYQPLETRVTLKKIKCCFGIINLTPVARESRE